LRVTNFSEEYATPSSEGHDEQPAKSKRKQDYKVSHARRQYSPCERLHFLPYLIPQLSPGVLRIVLEYIALQNPESLHHEQGTSSQEAGDTQGHTLNNGVAKLL
jgi:hypothetical protein